MEPLTETAIKVGMAKGRGNLEVQVPPQSHPSLHLAPRAPEHQDAPIPPPSSAAFLRLRDYIAQRMRMSPIDQPLMLMELLGR